MLRRVRHSIADFSRRFDDWRLQRYVEHRRIAARAPYPVGLYRSLLQQARTSEKLVITPFASLCPADGSPRVMVRHDVDTSLCVGNLRMLLDADAEFDIPAGVYVRVDGRAYDPAVCRQAVDGARARGFEVGLHSSCYLGDDAFEAFRVEIDAFTRSFGFQPESFTMHGLGPVRAEQRWQFYRDVVHRMTEFGVRFTDCNAAFRSYRYVIEDCHIDPRAPGARVIYDDVVRLPPTCARAGDHLILTHPCYWT